MKSFKLNDLYVGMRVEHIVPFYPFNYIGIITETNQHSITVVWEKFQNKKLVDKYTTRYDGVVDFLYYLNNETFKLLVSTNWKEEQEEYERLFI